VYFLVVVASSVVITSEVNCLERFVSEMTYHSSSKTLNLTHLVAPLAFFSLFLSRVSRQHSSADGR